MNPPSEPHPPAATVEANHHAHPATGGGAHGHPPHHDDGAVSAEAAAGTGTRIGLIAVVVVVVVLGLAATFAFRLLSNRKDANQFAQDAKESAEAPLPVEVVRVHRASTDRLIALPGEAKALYETTLYARPSGYLTNWAVDIGDR